MPSAAGSQGSHVQVRLQSRTWDTLAPLSLWLRSVKGTWTRETVVQCSTAQLRMAPL